MTLEIVIGKRKTRHEAWQREGESFKDFIARAEEEYAKKTGKSPTAQDQRPTQYVPDNAQLDAQPYTRPQNKRPRNSDGWTYLGQNITESVIPEAPYDPNCLIGSTFFK